MRCETARELISAELDGELTDEEETVLAHHVERCEQCHAFAVEAGQLQRVLRIAPAPAAPDLVPTVMAQAGPPPMFPLFVRYSLLVLAVIGLILAVPGLWETTMSDHAHATRHLGGWDIAFSIGLIVAAIQPARARGLLPMALALGGIMIATGVVDVIGGHAPAMSEITHALELVELVLLWLLVRLQPDDGTRRWRLTLPRPDDGHLVGGPGPLHVVRASGVASLASLRHARLSASGGRSRRRDAA